VRFQIFTVVSVKVTVVSDVTPCGLVEVYCHKGGTYFRYVQVIKILFYSENGGRPFFRKAGKNLTDFKASHPRRQ
jgi:hypothetical protein